MTSRVDAATTNDLTHCPQNAKGDLNPEDLHVTQSSILYLLQEATKLATPTKQHSLGTDGFSDRSKEESHLSSPIACSLKGQNNSSPITSSRFTGAFSVLNNVQNSSPWEVMSLINLQCERLLHSGRKFGNEDEPYSHLKNGTDHHKLVSDDLDVEERDDMECSFSSSGLTETNTSAVTGDMTECDNKESRVFCSMPHIIDQTEGEDKASGEIEAMDLTELIAKNSGNLYCGGSSTYEEGGRENSFLANCTISPLSVPKKLELCSQASPESSFQTEDQENKKANTPSTVTLPSLNSEISSVDFTSVLLVGKDINSNMCLSFNSCEKPELGNPLVLNTTEESSVISSRPGTDLNNNPHPEGDNEEKVKEPAEALVTLSTKPREGNLRRTPRKQAHPARSPDLQDPELQGVTFSMHSEVDHNTDQCRLLITNYRELCRRGRRGRGVRSKSLHNTHRTSSSEEESDSASLSSEYQPLPAGGVLTTLEILQGCMLHGTERVLSPPKSIVATEKICASCCTRKTPLWRDAEDGTPLCNACGIRYKKYRVRCLQCWNIPRKEANSNSKCLKCGDLLASQNKRTAL